MCHYVKGEKQLWLRPTIDTTKQSVNKTCVCVPRIRVCLTERDYIWASLFQDLTLPRHTCDCNKSKAVYLINRLVVVCHKFLNSFTYQFSLQLWRPFSLARLRRRYNQRGMCWWQRWQWAPIAYSMWRILLLGDRDETNLISTRIETEIIQFLSGLRRQGWKTIPCSRSPYACPTNSVLVGGEPNKA